MASKDKEAEDGEGENSAAEGEGAEAPKKGLAKILGLVKTKKFLMIGVPVIVLLLGGGGAGAYFFLFAGHEEGEHAEKKEEEPLTPPEVAFTDMQDILVNIQSSDGAPAYLKLAVSLELENEEEKAAFPPLRSRVPRQFHAYPRRLRVDVLSCSAGVLRLKEELLRRVNVAAAPYHVRDVLLKEMIVQ